MASKVLRGRNPCLACHEPLPAFRGAAIRCPHCGHINVYRVRLRTWSERPELILAERILKSFAIVITPVGLLWSALWPPPGPAHVAFFAPPAIAWLLWIAGDRLRKRGGFGRPSVVIRNVAGSFAVILTVIGAATGDVRALFCAVPCLVVMLLAPRIALALARTRRNRVARSLEG